MSIKHAPVPSTPTMPVPALSVNQAIIRGFNFFVCVTMATIGFAGFSEAFVESDHLIYGADETLLLLMGIVALIWYLTRAHRFQRSVVPLFLVAVDVGIKIFALVIESSSPDDIGDDIGVLQLVALLLIVSCVVYVRMRRQLHAAA